MQLSGKTDPEPRAVPAGARTGYARRFIASTAMMRARLLRGRNAADRIWTPRIGVLLVAGLAATLIAAGFDAAAIRFVRSSDAWLLAAMHAITDLGKSHWYLVPSAALFLWLSISDWRRLDIRGRALRAFLLGQALFVFAGVGLAGIVVNILKVLFGRARPILYDQFGAWHFDFLSFGYAYASFPSGHSTTVGSVMAVLILWYPRFWPVTLQLGILLGATRIAAQAHYPSDVAAGLLLGFTVTLLVARFLASRRVVFRLLPGRLLPAVARLPAR